MKGRKLLDGFGRLAGRTIIFSAMMATTLTLTGCAGDKGDSSRSAESVSSSLETGSPEGESTMQESEVAASESMEETKTKEEPTPEPTPSPEEIYADMVSRSLTYDGNNARIKGFIEKLRAGEEVCVALLGGSVTEGAGAGSNDKGYAYQFVKALKETYGNGSEEQIHYVVAGLSGTPSVLGLMRYQQDVLDVLGQEPDLLVIEFAVNDWQEATGGRAYESMVFEVLSAKEDCAVISLCSVAKTGWNTQDVYLPIAKHYQIPLVSLKDAVFISEKKTRIAATKYFMDDYHPKFYGHQLMKDCLMNLFAQADAAEADEPAPIPKEPVKGRDFAGIIQVDGAKKVKGMKPGSFSEVDDKVVTTYFMKSAAFPNNFYHPAGAKNDPLKMKVKCKKILVNFKTSSDQSFGKADFYVDGKLAASADGYSGGGWNNCNVLLVLDDEQAANHVLEVKMAEGSEDKAFTIFSISYAE